MMEFSPMDFILSGVNRLIPTASIFDGWEAPIDISLHGNKIDWLFDYTTALNVFYFALVCVGIFGFSYLYHHKRNRKAYFTYGNQKKHLVVTMVIGAAVFLSIDLTITGISTHDLLNTFWKYPAETEKKIRVEVMAQQWMWNFRYAGKDGLFNTADDILTNNDLRLPVGVPVEFRIMSKDVIHSFYLPNARRKVDAIPGRITRMWVHFTKTGDYDIACAEMCGTHHYLMQAKLKVYTEEEFNNWLNEAQVLSIAGNDPDNLDNYWGWKWETK
jgi:cytochrome c oxidase subunit 2